MRNVYPRALFSLPPDSMKAKGKKTETMKRKKNRVPTLLKRFDFLEKREIDEAMINSSHLIDNIKGKPLNRLPMILNRDNPILKYSIMVNILISSVLVMVLFKRMLAYS